MLDEGLKRALSGHPTHLVGLPCLSVKRPDLDTLKLGAVGGAAIRSVDEGEFNYVAVVGEMLAGDEKVIIQGVVLADK